MLNGTQPQIGVVAAEANGCIPVDDVRFHPHSFGDPDGRLFWWEGELYRGICTKRQAFYAGLLENRVVRSLMERGHLVSSESVPLTLEGFGMVIRHRTVPFVSYPNEWCAAMFKDATLAALDLAMELAREGLILKDHHLWNITFDGCKPVYVDLTSVVPLKDGVRWPDYGKFCRYCLYPLMLMAAGHERIARALLPEYNGITQTEMEALTGRSPFLARLRRAISTRASLSQLDYLRQLRGQIENVQLPATGKRDEPSSAALLDHVLAEKRPQSLLDVNNKSGGCSRLAARTGCRVAAFSDDSDDAAALYRVAREERLPILSLVMDFTKPTPAIGFSGHFSMSATDRFQAEMVVAMDLVQELVLKRSLTFDQIVDGLAAFSTRWVAAEFAAHERRDDFLSALRKRFREVETLSAGMILCEL